MSRAPHSDEVERPIERPHQIVPAALSSSQEEPGHGGVAGMPQPTVTDSGLSSHPARPARSHQAKVGSEEGDPDAADPAGTADPVPIPTEGGKTGTPALTSDRAPVRAGHAAQNPAAPAQALAVALRPTSGTEGVFGGAIEEATPTNGQPHLRTDVTPDVDRPDPQFAPETAVTHARAATDVNLSAHPQEKPVRGLGASRNDSIASVAAPLSSGEPSLAAPERTSARRPGLRSSRRTQHVAERPAELEGDSTFSVPSRRLATAKGDDTAAPNTPHRGSASRGSASDPSPGPIADVASAGDQDRGDSTFSSPEPAASGGGTREPSRHLSSAIAATANGSGEGGEGSAPGTGEGDGSGGMLRGIERTSGLYADLSGEYTIPGVVTSSDYDWHLSSVSRLLTYISEHTDVRVHLSQKYIMLGQDRLRDAPLIVFTGHKAFTLTDRQREALRRFVEDGGTIWGDYSGVPDFDEAFRDEMSQTFGREPEALPLDDRIYRAFYAHDRVLPGDTGKTHPFEGIRAHDGGRMAVIITRNRYFASLDGAGHVSDQTEHYAYEVGTNIFFYALREFQRVNGG